MEIKESLAAILVETRKPLVLETIKLPDKLSTGQVLVRLITSGICGAQINEIDAAKGPDNHLPHLLGHEGFAEVIEVGPAVEKVKPGDNVVLHWRPSSGIQSETPRYKLGNSVVHAGWVTTFNEFAVISGNRMTRVSKNLDPYFAPLLGCALTTALGVLENDAKISHRDILLITGFGGVGISILQFARFLGVRSVVVIDRDKSKRDLALNLGATSFIVADNKIEAMKRINDWIKCEGNPTVAIETTGNSSLIEFSYEVTTDKGRIILVGVPRKGDNASIYTLPLHFGKIMTGSKGGDSDPENDIPLICKLFTERHLLIENFPVIPIPFNEIGLAIEKLRLGVQGRFVMTF